MPGVYLDTHGTGYTLIIKSVKGETLSHHKISIVEWTLMLLVLHSQDMYCPIFLAAVFKI